MLREHGGPFFDAFRSKHPERYCNAPRAIQLLVNMICCLKFLICTEKQPHLSNRTLFVTEKPDKMGLISRLIPSYFLKHNLLCFFCAGQEHILVLIKKLVQKSIIMVLE